MKQNEESQKRLREVVESVVGWQMKGNQDFINLAAMILDRCQYKVSVTTLKRFWGTIEQEEQHKGIRPETLDSLARLCGYIDFQAFYEEFENGDVENVLVSEPCYGKILKPEHLERGQELQLMWKPNRCVTIRYEGLDLFTVLKSQNSKIEDGSTFHCNTFIEGEPLILYCLVSPGKEPVNYACAKGEGGLTWNLIKK